MRKIVEGNRPEKPGNNLRKVEPAGNSKAIARRDAHPVSKNNNNIKVKPAHRGKKKKKKVLPVLIAVGVVALIGIIIAGVFGDQYYSDAMAMKDRMQNRAEQLKIYLGDFANYVKDSNYDAADGTIAKIDNITGEMRGELSDPKWQVATFVPGVGSDLKNADKLLGIVEEASNTILKPTVKYLRNNGFIEGKKNINTKLILSKDFSVKLGELAEYIDTVCPAAEKVLTDFNSIPEFKMEQIESKISKYRKIAKDNDTEIRAYLKFIKEVSDTLIKPVAQDLNGKDLSLGEGHLSDKLNPEFASKLDYYADMIDKYYPVVDKLLLEISALPEFKVVDIEVKIGKIRRLAQNKDVRSLMNLAKEAPVFIRPATEVLKKTPFTALKTDKGLDTKVLRAYLDLATKVEPYINMVNVSLRELELLKKYPKVVDRVTAKLDTVMSLLYEFDTYKPLVDAVLGDGSDKLYLIVAMNSAEIRACGGFPGSIGTVTIKDGILEFGDFKGVYNAITFDNGDLIKSTYEENLLFVKKWFGGSQTRATTNPHFPRAAQILADGYKNKHKVKPDGVIAMTPHILSRLIAITEPVTLSNGVILDENYSMKYLQRDIYFQYFKKAKTQKKRDVANDITDQLFAEAADKTLKNVMSKMDTQSIRKLFEVVKTSGEDRVFMIWLADKNAQKVVKKLGFSGSLNTDKKHPEIGIFYSIRDANKLGFYVDLTAKLGKGKKNADGSMTYPVTVTLKNSIDKKSIKQGKGNDYLTSKHAGTAMRSRIYFFAPYGGGINSYTSTMPNLLTNVAYYKKLKVYYSPTFDVKPGVKVVFTFNIVTAKGVTEEPKIVMTPTLSAFRDAEAPETETDAATGTETQQQDKNAA